jgi:hypothetical protein
MNAASEAIPLSPPSQAKGEEERGPLVTPFETKGEELLTPFQRKGVATKSRGDKVAHEAVRLADIGFEAPMTLLARHGLQLIRVENNAPIPGSFWGEPEAGVIASTVYARADTPVHSLLHEACHLLVADPARRASIHTDASDSLEEEDATCYMQIVLADELPGFGRELALADMDAWGYSFRLGSARAWFEHDAEDARRFLEARGLIPSANQREPSRSR